MAKNKMITKDARVDYLSERIIETQKKLDILFDNLYKLDEDAGNEVLELIRAGEY